jgi:2-iminobutanoate/2-iminopropanoate deaminase
MREARRSNENRQFLPGRAELAPNLKGFCYIGYMKTAINLPNRPAGMPFSDAVQVGNMLYLSGRIGFKPGTMTPPEDPSEEARYLLDGVRLVLEHAGWKMSDLVQVQIFTPDVSLFDTFNRVYRTYFEGDLPARAFLGSGPLLFGARFEIVAAAAR